MKRFLLFIALAVTVSAQIIPGRYIVEFNTPPAAALMTPQTRLLPGNEPRVAARRAQIAAERTTTEQRVRALGGTVTHRYDTLINGIAVTLSDGAAAELRQMPNVRSVYPVTRHHALLDRAAKIHRIADAVQTFTNGAADAGKGIKIGILDTGIDAAHPGFQGFATPIPEGYPKVSGPSEAANTNGKIIVARSYLSTQGATDMVGHGTGTAMIAAGNTNDPATSGVLGIPPITGVAPAAWLGNYNVFDDEGFTDSATFLQALQDALDDGMNVVNYSVGGPNLSARINEGPQARAINAAIAAGMLIVAAAGNEAEFANLESGFLERYPGGGTISDPAAVPGVIAVGANRNDRTLGYAVAAADVYPYRALVPTQLQDVTGQITGMLVVVSKLDTDGLGCTAFPEKSLEGRIALIKRGTCTFALKLTNAQAAGAAAAVVYNNKDEAFVNMDIGDATLPATFISQVSGTDLAARAAENSTLQTVVDFNGTYAFPRSADLSIFSSAGPTPGGAVKPDLVAAGETVITADTTVYEQFGEYPPYMVLDGFGGSGTSFSAPFVTGSIAVLMSARPGLTAAQYRSLVTNSAAVLKGAEDSVVKPQQTGAGRLDLLTAVKNPLTADPPTVTFSAANQLTQAVVITNVGSASDTFTVAVNPINTDGTVPTVDSTSVSLNPGESKTVKLTMVDVGLPTGEYHGYISIAGSNVTATNGGPATRIPYWYGVPGKTPKYISLLSPEDPTGGSTGDELSFLVRVVDEVSLPVSVDAPEVTATGSGARIQETTSISDIPGTFRIRVRLGRADELGANVFTITSGGVKRTITVFIQ